jgi:hypothetical protein
MWLQNLKKQHAQIQIAQMRHKMIEEFITRCNTKEKSSTQTVQRYQLLGYIFVYPQIPSHFSHKDITDQKG